MANEESILWQSKNSKRGIPFLTVKNNDKFNYNFAERAGKDSVAFILCDYNADPEHQYGLVKEYKPPIDQFLVTAFGGSLDKSLTHKEIVKEEVKEEAGYVVPLGRIHYIGKRFVSTQMNQFCYLFFVNVTGIKPTGRNPEDAIEALTEVKWISEQQILLGYDWKSQAIIQHLKSGLYYESNKD